MTESSPSIEDALWALSDVCDGAARRDGQGFNGRDADFGNSLAFQARAGRPLTLRQRESAYRMLRTYRRQLAGLGIEYERIPAPPDGLPGRAMGPSPADVSPGLAVLPQFDAGSRDAPTLRPGGERPQPERSVRAPSGYDPEPSPYGAPGAAVVGDEAHPTARGILGPGGRIAQRLPGYESRAPQLALAELIERAIGSHEHAVIEAGTGTGKSLGYLVPVLLAGLPAVVSTADKALQAQLWLKDIPFLRTVLPSFRAALLKGRSNYLCLRVFTDTQRELQQLAIEGFGQTGFRTREAADVWTRVVPWAETTTTGDLEELDVLIPSELRDAVAVDGEGCLGQHCAFREQCFSERAKQIAKDAQLTVVNHALLLRELELRYQSEGQATVLPDVQIVVLDEAHHLEEIATDAFGVELTTGRYPRLVQRLERLTIKHPKVLAAPDGSEERTLSELWQTRALALQVRLIAWLDALRERLLRDRVTSERLGIEPGASELIEGIRALVRQLTDEAPYWLETEQREAWRKLSDAFSAYAEDLALITSPHESAPDGRRRADWVRYAELDGERLTLHAKPVDVEDLLHRRLFDAFPSVIATSATIATDTGLDFWRSRVGCDDALELVVSSPFDYARAALLYLPEDGKPFDPTLARNGGELAYLDALASEMRELVEHSEGRAFLLFTSNRALDEVYRRLAPALRERHLVLRQGDAPRPELVRRFRDDGAAVLFGVKSFWEGVDVQGDALSLVVVDKLPFPPPDDPVWAAKCEAVNRRYGNKYASFDRLAVPNATIALKQAFGRLIRTGSDRGVVALLDGRLTTKRYGARILRALPPARQTRVRGDVERFYRGARGGAAHGVGQD